MNKEYLRNDNPCIFFFGEAEMKMMQDQIFLSYSLFHIPFSLNIFV